MMPVAAGNSGLSTITVTPQNSFYGTVNLSAGAVDDLGNAAPGVTATFQTYDSVWTRGSRMG
jgi:hypothetical protein